jgi:hypothetical protein
MVFKVSHTLIGDPSISKFFPSTRDLLKWTPGFKYLPLMLVISFTSSADKLFTSSQTYSLHDPDIFEVPVHQGPLPGDPDGG